jgi:hypothetical protein
VKSLECIFIDRELAQSQIVLAHNFAHISAEQCLVALTDDVTTDKMMQQTLYFVEVLPSSACAMISVCMVINWRRESISCLGFS